jgi:SAM-dependent methyltransferase
MKNLRSVLWDEEALASNAAARDPEFGITARAASRRLPFRLLRYWFVDRLLREEALRRGMRLRVLEVGVHRGQMKAFVDGAATVEGHCPYLAWDAVDCALEVARLRDLGYGRMHQADLDDAVDLRNLEAAVSGATYDVIIVLHLLEHLHEPERVLASLSRALAPRGVVVGGFPVLPDWLAPIRERQLRRSAKAFGHVSAFSPSRLERMASACGFAMDFQAGAFGLRASGSRLEDSSLWLRLNLLFGAIFPAWPGELYWRIRRLAPATEPVATGSRPLPRPA